MALYFKENIDRVVTLGEMEMGPPKPPCSWMIKM